MQPNDILKILQQIEFSVAEAKDSASGDASEDAVEEAVVTDSVEEESLSQSGELRSWLVLNYVKWWPAWPLPPAL